MLTFNLAAKAEEGLRRSRDVQVVLRHANAKEIQHDADDGGYP
jgi:hypothetical protein